MATMYSAPNTAGVGEFACALHAIRISVLNPRKRFAPEQLQELAESIARHGLLEAIVVRETANCLPADPGPFVFYEVVAGERRLRALWIVAMARCAGEPIAAFLALPEEERERYREQAGLEEVPVRSLGVIDDAKHIELALVENLQRVDLDPIEEAEGYRQLNRVVGLTQAAIASAVKRSQPAVANALRLLDLPEDVRARIRQGELSPAHGISVAKYSDYPALASEVARVAVAKHLTSKEVAREIPEAWEMRQKGLLVELSKHDAKFDVAICKACPLGAYRKQGYYEGYCLKPEHYRELQAAAARAEEEKLAAALAQGEVPAAKSFTQGYISIGKDVPPGCSDDCACRQQAREGQKLLLICTDPGRYRGLVGAQHKARSDARRVAVGALRRPAVLLTRAPDAIPMRELMVLVTARLLVFSDGQRVKAIAEARGIPELAAFAGANRHSHKHVADLLPLLQAVSLRDLIGVLGEVVITGELHDAETYGEAYGTEWTEWLLGATGVMQGDAPADDAATAGEGEDGA